MSLLLIFLPRTRPILSLSSSSPDYDTSTAFEFRSKKKEKVSINIDASIHIQNEVSFERRPIKRRSHPDAHLVFSLSRSP